MPCPYTTNRNTVCHNGPWAARGYCFAHNKEWQEAHGYYVVARIGGHRGDGHAREWLVHWVGGDSSWEPEWALLEDGVYPWEYTDE